MKIFIVLHVADELRLCFVLTDTVAARRVVQNDLMYLETHFH